MFCCSVISQTATSISPNEQNRAGIGKVISQLLPTLKRESKGDSFFIVIKAQF